MQPMLLAGEASETLSKLWTTVTQWALHTGSKIIISVVILLVSFRVINVLARKIQKNGEKYDKTLMRTFVYAGKIAAKVLVGICLIGYLGIDTSGLSALIASLGLCFGLAVNGALANLAGGVMIILTRPFRIDDYIEAQGISGTVADIHLVSTKIRTNDNKIVYVPNGTLINGSITNFSEKEERRVDLTFSIGYANDFEKAKRLVLDICSAHPLVLKDPAPFVRVSEHASSSISIVTRVWVKTPDYWDVHFDLLEQVKKAFDANGIEIPFDQVDVHVKKD